MDIGESAAHRAIRERAAVVFDSHDVVWAEGRDSVAFLQGILSQDIEGTPSGRVVRSFLLGPQGKLKAMLRLARGDSKVALVVDTGQGPQLIEDLNYYRIRVKADLRLEDRSMFEVWGPAASEIVGMATPDGWRESDGEVLISIPMRGLDRVLVIGGDPIPEIPPAGLGATSVARVEFGEPVFGVDVNEATIPQETGLVADSVSMTKGCYLGQELVARIDSRGHVNRHLRALTIAGDHAPPEGTSAFAGDREVGRITSVSETDTYSMGLALLRREVEVGDEVALRWSGEEVPAIVRGVPIESDVQW